ncbi:hypothetical protein O3M35_012367 [Rhynocoris fuscipes]|uniref:Uncharacterized protein n=1 Tax=Rhynocoris fuscipes TaxID=488301 RepID=A0AAW1CYM0_9HEMI
MKKLCLVIFVLCGVSYGEQIQNTSAIDTIRDTILKKLKDLWTDIGNPDWQYIAKKKNGLDGEIVLEFKQLCEKFDRLTKPKIPDTILKSLWSWIIIEEELNNIDNLYFKFRQLQENPDPLINGKSWEELAQIIINDGPQRNSAFKSLEIMQDLIYDNVEGHKSIYDSVIQASDEQLCDLSQSTNQLIFNMYTLLQMVQLKAYTMIQFSWMLLRVYNKGNFSMETNLMKQSYLERMATQAVALKNALKSAKNDLWKCDPKIHSEGETYTEITRFLQGFIVNEVDLNSENTCRENCAFYKYTKQHSCFKNQFCSKQSPCKGNVVGCTFVDSDMWICQAPRWTNKRYDWIEYENGRTLGEKKTCTRAITKVDSWWRWLFWHCSYCFCFCDDSKDPLSNRYFNLREVTSDVETNKVITGIRFVKSSGVIHIQIQEGQLGEHGEVNSSSVTWKPVDDYNIESSGVQVGVDYHMLTWEHRAIDLDDLILPKDHILTGIKFRKVGGHLNLEIRGSEFNITSGKLKDSGKKSRWISNDNTDGAYEKPRTQLHLYKPDVPTKRSIARSEPDSKSDQYIEFTSTDVDADVSQSAVPFIDTQWVTPNPPIPLVGAGVYHKGSRYSGGFIALKVFTYDYSDQIVSFFPELNEAEFKK